MNSCYSYKLWVYCDWSISVSDIVMHSATKFIAGHSDVMAGVLAVKGERLLFTLLTAFIGIYFTFLLQFLLNFRLNHFVSLWSLWRVAYRLLEGVPMCHICVYKSCAPWKHAHKDTCINRKGKKKKSNWDHFSGWKYTLTCVFAIKHAVWPGTSGQKYSYSIVLWPVSSCLFLTVLDGLRFLLRD